MYLFSLKGPAYVGQIHHRLIYVFYCDFYQPYNKCQLIVRGTIYSSTQFTIWVRKGSFIFITCIKLNNSLFCIHLSHFVAYKVFL